MKQMEKIYGEVNDRVLMLSDVDIPVNSFSIYGLFGKRNTGKTTKQNLIVKTIKDRNQKLNQYDLDNPLNIQNAPITNSFLISPTAKIDLTTFINNDTKFKTVITLDSDDVMHRFINIIMSFAQTVTDTIKLQCQFRYSLKNKQIQSLIVSQMETLKDSARTNINPTLSMLFEVMGSIDQLKARYPYLKVKETNQQIIKHTQILYQIFNKKFDGYMIRRPSMIIQVDDASACRFLSGRCDGNPFYQLLTKTRHYGIYCTLINCHAITLLFGQMRQVLTDVILCQGLKNEHMTNLFDDLQLENKHYDKKQFIQTCHQTFGTDDDPKNGDKYKYNFIYIILDPRKQIFINFDKQIY
ncbi:Conserved_hypothetical protein [Hexamita inflata]|uniref:Uncharacterized protein n=1 Tax=Hexamita inflata TaxID=28002 RepID=A0AA86UXX9_9EUKA|nr:Conserved hypothetical protein [Hexamita inflata]